MAAGDTLIGIPVKPFGVAKQRLHPRMNAHERSALGKAIGARTVQAAAATGCEVLVVTGDAGVAAWAARLGVGRIDEGPPGAGLNGAAGALRDHALARDRPWLVLHADLPTVRPTDIAEVVAALGTAETAISPSHDGGTSALASSRNLGFSYGPGSFHRHLRAAPEATVVVRPGLAFDLDTVADFDAIAAGPDGAWLAAAMSAIDSGP